MTLRNVRRIVLAGALVLATGAPALAQPTPELIRARTEREWTIKADKMRRHLLPIMRRHEIDLWIILSRENAPDPVLELFGGYGVTGWYGHRNAYLFFDAGADAGLETTAIGTHLSGHLRRFYDTRTLYGEEGLMPHLREYLDARDPRRIAVNQSRTISMADGLTAELKDYLLETLGPDRAGRLVSSEPLVVDYASTHTEAEHEVQREASTATFDILRRAFSGDVITPGRTTLMDVRYWITAEWKRLGFEFNFPGSLDLQRPGGVTLDDADDPTIERGDLLHVDFGVRTSGIVADQQKMAYVLREGETAPPAGLGAGVRGLVPRGRADPRRDAGRPHRHRHQGGGRAPRRRGRHRPARLLARPGLLGARRRHVGDLRLARALRRPPAHHAQGRRLGLAGVRGDGGRAGVGRAGRLDHAGGGHADHGGRPARVPVGAAGGALGDRVTGRSASAARPGRTTGHMGYNHCSGPRPRARALPMR